MALAARRFGTLGMKRVGLPSCGVSGGMQVRSLHSQKRYLHLHENKCESPDEAMEILRDGNKRFVAGDMLAPNRNLERLKSTASGQKPFAAFLSCADSRVPVEIIFDQGFGDLFITRVAGNCVTTEVMASLEFGCAVLGAKVLYCLGHSSCGAVASTISGNAVPGVISSLYYHIRPACEHANGDVDKAVEENVRLQVKQLHVSPVLQELIAKGKLKIVGGVYDLATGTVKELDC